LIRLKKTATDKAPAKCPRYSLAVWSRWLFSESPQFRPRYIRRLRCLDSDPDLLRPDPHNRYRDVVADLDGFAFAA
jgi:hypothetical protein